MAKRSMNLVDWCKKKNRIELLEQIVDKEQERLGYNTAVPAKWLCSNGHIWLSPVVARTLFNRECPICNPSMESLPIGTKYGCMTIIKKIDEETKKKNDKELEKLKKERDEKLKDVTEELKKREIAFHYNMKIAELINASRYKCQCKCGKIKWMSELEFLHKKHRFCDSENMLNFGMFQLSSGTSDECGLRKAQEDSKLASYKRMYAENYDIDFSGTFHESLEVLECINDRYEELSSYSDKRKKGAGTVKVYKLYKCRCYLCGKEQKIKCSAFHISPPTKYGFTAYNGYWSAAKCDCHKISSFQWIVNKLLTENNVSYRVEKSFDNLYGTNNKVLLRYDFAVLDEKENVTCLIECQGEQHYKPVDEFGGNYQYENQQKNDELKRNYAKEQGIPLYEISHKDKKYEKVEKFLKENGII